MFCPLAKKKYCALTWLPVRVSALSKARLSVSLPLVWRLRPYDARSRIDLLQQ
jgi:hypothetical protein